MPDNTCACRVFIALVSEANAYLQFPHFFTLMEGGHQLVSCGLIPGHGGCVYKYSVGDAELQIVVRDNWHCSAIVCTPFKYVRVVDCAPGCHAQYVVHANHGARIVAVETSAMRAAVAASKQDSCSGLHAHIASVIAHVCETHDILHTHDLYIQFRLQRMRPSVSEDVSYCTELI